MYHKAYYNSLYNCYIPKAYSKGYITPPHLNGSVTQI